jgi:hypothetical protein
MLWAVNLNLTTPGREVRRTTTLSLTLRVSRGGRSLLGRIVVSLQRRLALAQPDEYVGKRGLVKNQVITCQDVDPSGYRLLMPFDYTLNEEEKAKYAGKLQDRTITVGIRELLPFGGRLRARGAIVAGPEAK